MLSKKIRALNLECIAFKVAYDEGWDLDKIDDAELYYRCFLQANANNPKLRLAPSRKIDVFWHHHILDTQKYIDDCNEIFGFYLNHFPYSGLRSKNDELEQKTRFKISQLIIEQIAESERNERTSRNPCIKSRFSECHGEAGA